MGTTPPWQLDTKPQPGQFVETREYRRFAEFCDACSERSWIGVCCGHAGVGKTASSEAYADWSSVEPHLDLYLAYPDGLANLVNHRTVYYRASQSDGPRTILKEIARLRLALSYVVADAERGGARTGQMLLTPPDCTRLIIVDEADQLKVPALEELRNVFDRGGIGLVLNGLPEFRARLTRYPKLYSRIGFAHVFPPLRPNDATAFVLEHASALRTRLTRDDFPDSEAVARIVILTGGNMRLMEKLLGQIERILLLTRSAPENAGKRVVVKTDLVDLAANQLVLGTE